MVIASDQKGQYAYALTIGDRIRTTLTPMTFSKPTFAGIQFDLATDKYEATVPPFASQCARSGRNAVGRYQYRSLPLKRY